MLYPPDKVVEIKHQDYDCINFFTRQHFIDKRLATEKTVAIKQTECDRVRNASAFTQRS